MTDSACTCRGEALQTSEMSAPLGTCPAGTEDGAALRRPETSADVVQAPNGTARTAAALEPCAGLPRERDEVGRFVPGNQLAKGHGGSAHNLARFRRLTLEATTEADLLDVWRTLIACAKAGEPWAVHEFLDRTMGKVALPKPEPAEDLSEVLAREYQRWLRPAEVVYGERLAALEEENRQLREAVAAGSEQPAPRARPLGREPQRDSTRSTEQ